MFGVALSEASSGLVQGWFPGQSLVAPNPNREGRVREMEAANIVFFHHRS